MHQTDIQQKALKSLQEFEDLPYLTATPTWELSLKERLSAPSPCSGSFVSVNMVSLAVLLLALMNISFVFKIIEDKKGTLGQRERELLLIQKELLVNPISIDK